MNDEWMTVKDVATYLKLSPDLIYRLAQRGKIPAYKVGNRWRFKKTKVDHWMEGMKVSSPEDVLAEAEGV